MMNLFLLSLNQKIAHILIKTGAVLLGTWASMTFNSSSAIAAEEIILRYGAASQTVSLEELEEFTTTGKTSPSLNFIFDFSKQNPQIARLILGQKWYIDTVLASNLLNSPPGKLVLSVFSQFVHTKSDRANIEALRGALIQSASDDSQVSLLELLQNYPTQQVYVDGKLLNTTTKDINKLIQNLEKYIEISLLIGEKLELTLEN